MSITPYYQEQGITIYHGDCREVLPGIKPQGVQLLLTDPPYGARTQVNNARFTGGSLLGGCQRRDTLQSRVPVHGDTETFDPTHLLNFPRLVLWGAQWYSAQLPNSGGWLVWDKRRGIETVDWPLSEAELAWTNVCHGVHMFRHRWFGLTRETERGQHYHPTQKPVALMRWVIERWADPGAVICDPYMGSGPTVQAAKEVNRQAIGIEIEERYCEIAVNRLRQGVLALVND